jgi:hypothetical protein
MTDSAPEGPQATPPALEPAQPAGPPATGWAVPAPPAPRKPPSRAMIVLSWVTALILAAFGAWIAMRATPGDSAYRWGYAFGAAVGPFLLAAILRLIFVRVRDGKTGAPVLRSPWVPLGAALLIALNGAGSIASLAPPRPVEAATAMHVRTPFTIRETDAAVVQQIEAGLREDPSVRSVAVREVVGGDGSISILLAADGRLRDGDLGAIVKSVGDLVGVAPTIETIGGESVVIAKGPEGFIGSWIDAPLMVQVYAVDRATLDAVIEAVTGSG